MVNDIKRVKEAVRQILVENEEARENDDLLYLLVCQERIGSEYMENKTEERDIALLKQRANFLKEWCKMTNCENCPFKGNRTGCALNGIPKNWKV